MAGKYSLRIATIQQSPTVEVVPTPDATLRLLRLLRERAEAGVGIPNRDRTQLCVFRLPRFMFRWLFTLREFRTIPPKNGNVVFVPVADLARNINVRPGEVWRRIEELKDFLRLRHKAGSVGQETGHLLLGKRFSVSTNSVERYVG